MKFDYSIKKGGKIILLENSTNRDFQCEHWINLIKDNNFTTSTYISSSKTILFLKIKPCYKNTRDKREKC